MKKKSLSKVFKILFIGFILCMSGMNYYFTNVYAEAMQQPPASITLDRGEVTLFRNQKLQLKASLLPLEASDASVLWSSKNEQVAKVSSSGEVTAVSRGTTEITAGTNNGLQAVCKVHVLELPQSIKLSDTSVTLFKGNKTVLSAEILPKKAAAAGIQWVSKDEKVAVVSESGEVTALNYGTTKIIAKTLGGKKASCRIRVTAPPKKILLNQTSVSLVQGKTLRLKADVRPEKAAGSVISWKSSNEKVAVVDSRGKVTALSQGTATITAAAENGVKAKCVVKSVMQYKVSGRTLKISSAEGTRTYYAYSQKENGYNWWYRSNGCVTTAVAIVASACGKSYTPKDIHEGSVSKAYSERYAVTKMGKAETLSKWYERTAISVRTASCILTNMGIKNKAVYTYDRAEALKEIREHLKAGKPVIVKVNNNVYEGRQLGYPHHAIVLAGIDENDHVVCINRGSAYLTTYTLKTMLYHHMTPASGNYKEPYMTDLKTAGGYILAD